MMPDETAPLPLLPYYVYILADSRGPQSAREPKGPKGEGIFYVGEGEGDRIGDHEANALGKHDRGERLSDKERRIIQIREADGKLINGGESVNEGKLIKSVIARFKTKEKAVAAEAVLIDWVYGLENLTNDQHGHGTDTIRKYGTALFARIEALDVEAPAGSANKPAGPEVRDLRTRVLGELAAEHDTNHWPHRILDNATTAAGEFRGGKGTIKIPPMLQRPLYFYLKKQDGGGVVQFDFKITEDEQNRLDAAVEVARRLLGDNIVEELGEEDILNYRMKAGRDGGGFNIARLERYDRNDDLDIVAGPNPVSQEIRECFLRALNQPGCVPVSVKTIQFFSDPSCPGDRKIELWPRDNAIETVSANWRFLVGLFTDAQLTELMPDNLPVEQCHASAGTA